MLRVPLLLLLVCPAAAYIRIATAVGGDVVKGAGDLTKGGKVGLYTVLLQAGMNIICDSMGLFEHLSENL